MCSNICTDEHTVGAFSSQLVKVSCGLVKNPFRATVRTVRLMASPCILVQRLVPISLFWLYFVRKYVTKQSSVGARVSLDDAIQASRKRNRNIADCNEAGKQRESWKQKQW